MISISHKTTLKEPKTEAIKKRESKLYPVKGKRQRQNMLTKDLSIPSWPWNLISKNSSLRPKLQTILVSSLQPKPWNVISKNSSMKFSKPNSHQELKISVPTTSSNRIMQEKVRVRLSTLPASHINVRMRFQIGCTFEAYLLRVCGELSMKIASILKGALAFQIKRTKRKEKWELVIAITGGRSN